MPSVILKATEWCNAHCTYCDVVHKPEPEVRTMSLDVLERFYVRVDEWLRARPWDRLEIVWHGGEPLLAGLDFYRAARRFADARCPTTKHRIDHSMQSNLTCFSEEAADVLWDLGLRSLGTSYEMYAGIRGMGRKVDSAAYNRLFMEGVRILEKKGFDWGLIYVVCKPAVLDPLGTFRFLTNLRPRGNFMMNPVLLYEEGNEDLRISVDEYVDFLGTIFPVWWAHRHRWPNVNPFRSYVTNLLEGGKQLACVESGNCADSHFNLSPDGSLSQCGRSNDYGLLDYGDVDTKSLTEVFDDAQRDLLRHRNQVLFETDCKDCRFWTICHGGCPLDAWADKGTMMAKTPWCLTKKDFLEKYFEPITGTRFEPPRLAAPEFAPRRLAV